jgi:hypothetical protein
VPSLKKEWSYTPTPHWNFMACSGVNFNRTERNVTNIDSKCVLSPVPIKGFSIFITKTYYTAQSKNQQDATV